MNNNPKRHRSHSQPRAFSKLKPALASAILLGILVAGCKSKSEQPGQNELVVSAAISLKDAFNEIGDLNEKRNATKVRFNYGASGELEKQIEAGAPADIFASAGAKQMDDLLTKSMIVMGTRRDFAKNSLVLVTPGEGPTVASFADLASPQVKKIAIGNPKTVPAGQYTEQTFTSLKLLPGIQSKLVFAGDVRQVLDYVVRGEVDAGVVYSSDAFTAGDKVRVAGQAADDSHDPILYPIAVIKESKQQDAAKKFIDLVTSPEGQDILAKHGFVKIK